MSKIISFYSQICALNSCDKRHSEKLTVNREMTKNLTVNRQRDPPPPPPPIETLFHSKWYLLLIK